MINEQTRRKLRLLNIGELIDELELQQMDERTIALSFDERFQMLIDNLYQRKYNEKVHRLIKNAKLRLPKADVHDIYYGSDRRLNKSLIDELATCRYIDECQSVIIQGYTSSGKTFLGCALAKEACRHQFRTRYIRLPDLLMEYAENSLLKGGKEKLLKKYSAFKVLVIDEWLINDLTKDEIEFIFELSERRFDVTSTIFCTLYKKEEWIKRLGRGTLAESIAERYEHNVYHIETGEMNMRAFYNKLNTLG